MQSPERATMPERAAILRTLLAREIAGLHGSKRGDEWARVLHAAYVEPRGKHESLARTLGMSYSTFRRLLTAGTEHLVAALWTRTHG
jgi:transcriptional regulator with AAA-type ATPase domain